MKAKISQQDFLEQKIAENSKRLNLSVQEKNASLAALDEIKEKLDIICTEITNYESTFHSGNIFPYWSKLKKDGIEFEKDGEIYIRRSDDYKYCTDCCIDAISLYVKHPVLHCDELSNLLLTLYFVLHKRYLFNYLGFKFIPRINGWRYNFWGALTGNYRTALILGTLTSGYILFPLLAFIILAKSENNITEAIAGWLGILFAYKIIKLVILWFLSLFNIRSARTQKIINFLKCYDYITLNDMLQPSKLKELSSIIDDLPAPVSILISQVQNNNDILEGAYNFISLYQDKK